MTDPAAPSTPAAAESTEPPQEPTFTVRLPSSAWCVIAHFLGFGAYRDVAAIAYQLQSQIAQQEHEQSVREAPTRDLAERAARAASGLYDDLAAPGAVPDQSTSVNAPDAPSLQQSASASLEPAKPKEVLH